MVSKKDTVLVGLAVAGGLGVAAAYGLSKKTTTPPPSVCSGQPAPTAFLCTCMTSSGVVASLPTGATTNGTVVVTYAQSLGCKCAADGNYLFISQTDAHTLGVPCGYYQVTAGGSGILQLLVSPSTVSPGGTLDYSGANFTPNGTVEINGVGSGWFQVYPTVKADASGNIRGSVIIPSNAGAGPAELKAGDEGTAHVVAASFMVA